MEFSRLDIFDFSGYRFYYGLGDTATILIETPTTMVDLVSMQRYPTDTIKALLRLTKPDVNYIHDNLEVRLDKYKVDAIIDKFPDYGWALRDQLEKMSVYASNLRFYLGGLLKKIQEILEDYSGTNYHETKEKKKHFIRRVISNFDRYIRLDELPLNWVNFIDCLAQYPTSSKILVVNTWRSFLVIQNYLGSDFQSMYYPFSRDRLKAFEKHPEVNLLHLGEDNIDDILNPENLRVHNSAITTTNPVRYIK